MHIFTYNSDLLNLSKVYAQIILLNGFYYMKYCEGIVIGLHICYGLAHIPQMLRKCAINGKTVKHRRFYLYIYIYISHYTHTFGHTLITGINY